MDWTPYMEAAQRWIPLLVVILLSMLTLATARWILFKRSRVQGRETGVFLQLAYVGLVGIIIISVILVLPVGDSARGQLLSLVGLLVTAAIALSSATFVSNAMAGLMLRTIGAFRMGDFVRVGEHTGRVSDRGLLHTEIQTEDRDLTTLPNLFLVTNPLTVVRTSGTVVSASVSIGYDVPHTVVEGALLEAARRAELGDPFVQIASLGDFSVVYRVAGFLGEVKFLISARSKLRRFMLDTLHDAEIEIISPTFMNQRQIQVDAPIIPADDGKGRAWARPAHQPEELMFDKADEAESRAALEEKLQRLRSAKIQITEHLDDADDPSTRDEINQKREQLAKEITQIEAELEQQDDNDELPTP